MTRRRSEPSRLPPPYLSSVWLDETRVSDTTAYPFVLPFFRNGFAWDFDRAITIVVGENGVGKSTLIEGLAALAGFDEAGGSKDHRPLDHSTASEVSGARLADALKAKWRPKVTNGWFFRAESFYSVARYLDASGSTSADFLSHSHGEGFMRVFEERCSRHGLYLFDEPESALSPMRQIEFMKLMQRVDQAKNAQVIMATHAPLLMALPGARLLKLTRDGLSPTTLEETDHFSLMRDFCRDPHALIAERLDTRD